MADEMEPTVEGKEMAIFLDVFRRADKNDDGALSWSEFQSFFADGVLSRDDLQKLFNEIDTHNTNNIDTGELCSYFSQHLGAFRDIFRAVDDLNLSVNKALMSSAQEYPKASFTEQFVTRFLLREIISQLSAVIKPLDAASDSLDEKAHQDRSSEDTPMCEQLAEETARLDVDDSSAPNRITPGRVGRRAKRQLSSQISSSSEKSGGSTSLNAQVDRLRSLVDRLENRVNLNSIPDEIVDIKNEKRAVIVHRKMLIEDEKEKAFHTSLRTYVEETNSNEDCLHLSVQTYAGSNAVVLYEIWKEEEAWRSHMSSGISKAFQRNNVDYLQLPEQINSLPVPASWWNHME